MVNPSSLSGHPALERAARNLLEQGAAVFVPLGQSTGADLVIRSEGRYVELRIVVSTAQQPFRIRRLRPRSNLFILGTVEHAGESPDHWVLPSAVFERFGQPNSNGEVTLDLDAVEGEPLRKRLGVYRNRWQLVTHFSHYESVLRDAQALSLRLSLG